MKRKFTQLAKAVLAFPLAILALSPQAKADAGDLELWYNAEADQSWGQWPKASLPIGNGRMGASVRSGSTTDLLTLNEVSLWSGGQNLPNNGNGYDGYGPLSDKDSFGCYQPFADLYVTYTLPEGEVSDYNRALNISQGLATSEFIKGGVTFSREAFVSHPNDVIVYRANANSANQLTATITLKPYHTVTYTADGNDGIIMSGTLTNGEKFEGRVYVHATGGSVAASGTAGTVSVSYTTIPVTTEAASTHAYYPSFSEDNIPYITVTGATSFEVYVSLATNYKEDYESNWVGADPNVHNEQVINTVKNLAYDSVRAAHIKDHTSLMGRVSLNLGTTDTSISSLPTNERVQRYRNGSYNDPELETLLYQFGRYMLIAGSRPGSLPLNLQGIWNNMVRPPWASDYHNNINIQMCYWGAEVGNLPECHQPLIDYIDAMRQPLHEMTVRQYGFGTPGWTTRISQNPWGAGGWTKWNPPINAWYAHHLWEHYLFTKDEDFLRNTAYPIIKEACEFWKAELKEAGENGCNLMTENGTVALSSTEYASQLNGIAANALVAPNGWSHEQGPVEDCCMHDQQLVWELFDTAMKASTILNQDADWATNLQTYRDRLIGNKISSDGYLQEWIVDRKTYGDENMLSGHRHTSHLYGVFPGSSISRDKNSAFMTAAAQSLTNRGSGDDNKRSWTWPWRTALWARFGQADNAYTMVKSYVQNNMNNNLFGDHPPMQLDGTYGITAGISEMLVQSHTDKIELLPALPSDWANGSVSGIKARGNITVNMTWANSQITDVSLTTTDPSPSAVTVVYNNEEHSITPTVATAANATDEKGETPTHWYTFDEGMSQETGTTSCFNQANIDADYDTTCIDSQSGKAMVSIAGTLVPCGLTSASGDFTAVASVRSVSLNNAALMSFGRRSVSGVAIVSGGVNAVKLITYSNDAITGTQTVPISNPTRQFHHYAIVRSGDQFTLYVDGVSKASLTQTGVGQEVRLGEIYGGNGHLGTVAESGVAFDDFRVYNSALAATDVAFYASFFPAYPTGSDISQKVMAFNFAKNTYAQAIADDTKANLADWEVPGSAWHQYTGSSSSEAQSVTKEYDTGTSTQNTISGPTIAWSGNADWGVGAGSKPQAPQLEGYIDGGSIADGVSVTVGNVPYSFYSVLLMYATDISAKYNAPQVNGSYYTYSSGSTVSASAYSDVWGQSLTADVPVYGTNAIKIPHQSSPTLTVKTGHQNASGTSRGCIAAMAIIEEPNPSITATISEASDAAAPDWTLVDSTATCENADLHGSIENMTLTVSENATWQIPQNTLSIGTLTLNVASGKTLKFSGSAANLTVDKIVYSGEGEAWINGDMLKNAWITDIETVHIDCTTASVSITDSTVLNTLRDSGMQYIFHGGSGTGVTLQYGTTDNDYGTIASHFVFDGGTHTFHFGQYGNHGSTAFGSGATETYPTVHVTGNARLNWTAKDPSGWSGSFDSKGIIRVDDGSSLYISENSSHHSIFYRQQIYLEPGATLDFRGVTTANKFFLHGGETGNQIYVPAYNNGHSSTVATINGGNIRLSSEATVGFGIYVGAGATLQMNCGLSNDNGRPINKYGAGTVKLNGSASDYTGTLTVSEGTFVVNGTELANATVSVASGANLKIKVDSADISDPLTLFATSMTNTELAERVSLTTDGTDTVVGSVFLSGGNAVFSKAAVTVPAKPMDFAYYFLGNTDGSWGVNDNWRTVTSSSANGVTTINNGGGTVADSKIPLKRSSNLWGGALLDGDIMTNPAINQSSGYREITADSSTCELEGWHMCMALTNHVKVTVGQIHYFKNADSANTIMVDSTSKLLISGYGDNGDCNGTHNFYVDSPDGVELAFAFTPTSSGTYNYYLGEEGSVKYSSLAGSSACTHNIKSVAVNLTSSASGIKRIAERKLVSFGSKTDSHTFSGSGAVVTVNDGSTTTTATAASSTLTTDAAVGTYEFTTKTDGCYIRYVDYVDALTAEATGTVDFSSLAWTHGGSSATLANDSVAVLTLSEGAEVTMPASAVTIGTLVVNGSGKLVFQDGSSIAGNLTLGEGVTLKLPESCAYYAVVGVPYTMTLGTGTWSVGTIETPSVSGYTITTDTASATKTATYTATSAKFESININFYRPGCTPLSSGNPGAFSIPGASWYNVPRYSSAQSSDAKRTLNLTELRQVEAEGKVISHTGALSVESYVYANNAGSSLSQCASTASSDLFAEYLEENGGYEGQNLPIITVTGIPYAQYRVIVYCATDTANKRFGYCSIGGVDYTSTNTELSNSGPFRTVRGQDAWGHTGAEQNHATMAEGVNYLVSDVISSSDSVTIAGHRAWQGYDPQRRGSIAAIQIVEVGQAASQAPTLTATASGADDTVWKYQNSVATCSSANLPTGANLLVSGTETVTYEPAPFSSVGTIAVSGSGTTLVLTPAHLNAVTTTTGGITVSEGAVLKIKVSADEILRGYDASTLVVNNGGTVCFVDSNGTAITDRVSNDGETLTGSAIVWGSSATGEWDVDGNWVSGTAPSDGVDAYLGTSGATITVSANSDAGVVYVYESTTISGTGAALQAFSGTISSIVVAEGKTLTIQCTDNSAYTFGAAISGAGSVAVNRGVVTFSMAQTYAGGLTVKQWTIAQASAGNGFGPEGARITVEAGGTLDMLNAASGKYNLTIAGTGTSGQGAVICSEEQNGFSWGSAQLASITLSANATIASDNQWGLINAGYDPSTLALGGYTLTKKGSGKFWLCCTTISGTGGIVVEDGALALQAAHEANNKTVTGTSATITVQNGAEILIGADNLNVGTLTVDEGGTVTLGSRTLTVGTALTVNGELSVASGGTVACNGDLTVGGTVTVDGAFTVAAGKSITKSGTGSIAINSAGTFTWNNTSWTSSGDIFTGEGTLVLHANGKLSHTVSSSFDGILNLTLQGSASATYQHILGNASTSGFLADGAMPELKVNTGYIYLTPYYDGHTLNIRDLSGNGYIDSRYNSTARDQKIVTTQTKNTSFSGQFVGEGTRKNSLTVQGDDSGTLHTLTLGGDSSTEGTLIVTNNAKVVFTSAGKWDDGTVNVDKGGYLESTNSATVATTLNLNDGGTIVIPVVSEAAFALTATSVVLPASGQAYIDVSAIPDIATDGKVAIINNVSGDVSHLKIIGKPYSLVIEDNTLKVCNDGGLVWDATTGWNGKNPANYDEAIITAPGTVPLDGTGLSFAKITVAGSGEVAFSRTGSETVGAQNIVIGDDATLSASDALTLSGTSISQIDLTGSATGRRTGVFNIPSGVTCNMEDVTCSAILHCYGNLNTTGTTTVNGESTMASWATFYSGSTLTVQSGTTSIREEDKGFKGNIVIQTGAKLVENRGYDDGLDFNATTVVDVYGTLEMAGTDRWSLSANNTINMYAGSKITGNGGGNGGLDWFGNSTLNVNGNAELNIPIKTRNNIAPVFDIDEECTLTVSKAFIAQSGNNANGSVNKAGEGTLRFYNIALTKPITGSTGTVVFDNDTTGHMTHTVTGITFSGTMRFCAATGNDRRGHIIKNTNFLASGTRPQFDIQAPGSGAYNNLYLDPNFNNGTLAIRDLTGSGRLTAQYSSGTARNQTTETKQTQDTEFSGIIDGDTETTGHKAHVNNLIVIGDGSTTVRTLTLSGVNDTPGTLTISDKTKVKFSSTGSWANGSVVVNDGGYIESYNASAITPANLTLNSGAAVVLVTGGSSLTTFAAGGASFPNGTVKVALGAGVTESMLTGVNLMTYTSGGAANTTFEWDSSVDASIRQQYAFEKGDTALTIGSAYATFNNHSYTSVGAALSAANDAGGGTVTLVQNAGDSATDITVPAGVVLDVGSKTLTARTLTVKGEVDFGRAGNPLVYGYPAVTTLDGNGLLVLDVVLPTAANAHGTEWETILTNATWQGTAWIKNFAGDTSQFSLQKWGNSGSKIKLTATGGYIDAPSSTGHTDVEAEVIFDDGTGSSAFVVRNGNSYTSGSYRRYTWFKKVSGTGTLSSTKLNRPCFVFKDAADYTGTLNIAGASKEGGYDGPIIVFSGGDTPTLPTAADSSTGTDGARIFVQENGSAAIGSGKSWTATNGITISGSVTTLGAATMASAVTLNSGAALTLNGTLAMSAGAPTFASGTVTVTVGDSWKSSVVAGTTLISWTGEEAPAGTFTVAGLDSSLDVQSTSTGLVVAEVFARVNDTAYYSLEAALAAAAEIQEGGDTPTIVLYKDATIASTVTYQIQVAAGTLTVDVTPEEYVDTGWTKSNLSLADGSTGSVKFNSPDFGLLLDSKTDTVGFDAQGLTWTDSTHNHLWGDPQNWAPNYTNTTTTVAKFTGDATVILASTNVIGSIWVRGTETPHTVNVSCSETAGSTSQIREAVLNGAVRVDAGNVFAIKTPDESELRTTIYASGFSGSGKVTVNDAGTTLYVFPYPGPGIWDQTEVVVNEGAIIYLQNDLESASNPGSITVKSGGTLGVGTKMSFDGSLALEAGAKVYVAAAWTFEASSVSLPASGSVIVELASNMIATYQAYPGVARPIFGTVDSGANISSLTTSSMNGTFGYAEGNVTFTPAVAKATINNVVSYYGSLQAALKAAEAGGGEVELVVARTENVNIPAGVTLKVSTSFALDGDVTGAGKVVFPEWNDATEDHTMDFVEGWTGTVVLPEPVKHGYGLNRFGNANSTVRLLNLPKTVVNEDAWTEDDAVVLPTVEYVGNGYYASLSSGFTNTFTKVIGAGTLGYGYSGDTSGNNPGAYWIKDASEWLGNIDVYGTLVDIQLGGTAKDNVGSGKIRIGSGSTVSFGAGKNWKAYGGIEVSGTVDVKGAASMTIAEGGSGSLVFNGGSGLKFSSAESKITASMPMVIDGVCTVSLPSSFAVSDGAELVTYTSKSGKGYFEFDSETASRLYGYVLYTDATSVRIRSKSTPIVVANDETLTITEPWMLGAPITVEAGGKIAVDESITPGGELTLANVTWAEGASKEVTVTHFEETWTTNVTATVDGSVTTIAWDPQIDGKATKFDMTFTNTVKMAYSCMGYGGDLFKYDLGTTLTFTNTIATAEQQSTYIQDVTNPAKYKYTAITMGNRPYFNGGTDNEDNSYAEKVAEKLAEMSKDTTFVVVGTMPSTTNTIFMHIGSSWPNKGGMILYTTGKTNEVCIAGNYGTSLEKITTLTVPHSYESRHSYVITKESDVAAGKMYFTVYLDGKKWTKTSLPYNEFSPKHGGIQVGGDFGGSIRAANILKGATDGNVNVIRIYDRILTEKEAKQYAIDSEYPYVSPTGTYTRDVSTSGTWIDESKPWTGPADGESNTKYAAPATDSTLEITTSVASTLNLGTMGGKLKYDSLVITEESAAELTITSNSKTDAQNKYVYMNGVTEIHAPLRVKNMCVQFFTAPLMIYDGGSLTFDFSDFTDVTEFETFVQAVNSDVDSTSTLPLTGYSDAPYEAKKVRVVPPNFSGAVTKRFELKYDEGRYILYMYDVDSSNKTWEIYNGTMQVNPGMNNTYTIKVHSGGALDVFSLEKDPSEIVLDGGLLFNSQENADETKAQFYEIELAADSYVEAETGHDFISTPPTESLGTPDDFLLNGHALYKQGEGKFTIAAPKFNSGALVISNGTLAITGSMALNDGAVLTNMVFGTLEVGTGVTLSNAVLGGHGAVTGAMTLTKSTAANAEPAKFIFTGIRKLDGQNVALDMSAATLNVDANETVYVDFADGVKGPAKTGENYILIKWDSSKVPAGSFDMVPSLWPKWRVKKEADGLHLYKRAAMGVIR